MVNYNVPKDLLDHIKSLEDRIVSLERRPRAGNTSIDTGALTATDTDGAPLIIVGEHLMFNTFPGADFRGSAFYRTGPGDATPGRLAMSIGKTDVIPGFPDITTIWDKDGTAIFADDVVTGGLARPYISVPMIPSDFSAWPSTTSGTFTGILTSRFTKQHPKLYVGYFLYANNADTSAELRVMYNGVQLGSTATYDVGTGPGTIASGVIADFLTGNLYSSFNNISIEIRRTAGTGTVFAQTPGVYGIQT